MKKFRQRKEIRTRQLLVFAILFLLLSGISNAQKEKPRVIIIATGGTIASVQGDMGLRPAYKPEEFIRRVPELKDYATLDGKLIMSLDSTNMQPGDWEKIAESVVQAQNENFRGIVITHGTDTMAYTASMLSFMVRNPKIPVVLTGAQKSIGEKESDAAKNLTNAVQFAAYGPPGIFVVFDGKVIKGIHSSKMDTAAFDTFHSINAPYVAKFINGKGKKVSNPLPVEKIDWPAKSEKETVLDTKIDPNVAYIRLSPGFQPEWLRSFCNPARYHGLVIEGFGAGNIPNRDPYNLLPVLEDFKKAGIPVVVMSQCPYGAVDMDIYETGEKAAQTGVIPSGTMTKEAALTKLMWVLGRTDNLEEIRKMMLENMIGEMNGIRK